MTHSGATWRRLKMCAEVRVGHGLPRLPVSELVRTLGVLALARSGGPLADEGGHEAAGLAEAQRLGVDAKNATELEAAIVKLAQMVDVRRLL